MTAIPEPLAPDDAFDFAAWWENGTRRLLADVMAATGMFHSKTGEPLWMIGYDDTEDGDERWEG